MPAPIPKFPPPANEMEALEQKHVIVTAWLANVREELARGADPARRLPAVERNLSNLLATIEDGLRAWN